MELKQNGIFLQNGVDRCQESTGTAALAFARVVVQWQTTVHILLPLLLQLYVTYYVIVIFAEE